MYASNNSNYKIGDNNDEKWTIKDWMKLLNLKTGNNSCENFYRFPIPLDKKRTREQMTSRNAESMF